MQVGKILQVAFIFFQGLLWPTFYFQTVNEYLNKLRVHDVEQQSAITSTRSAGVLRHLPPPVAQNGSTGKREGGSVWCGCLLWYGFLPLLGFSTFAMVFYHWYGFYY